MQMLLADLRDAVRSLRKQPRFLIIASLTLALGIGAVTAIFSVVNGVLLQPLRYPHSARLANVWSTAPGLDLDQFPLSPDLFLFYRRHNQVFEDMALSQNQRINLTEAGSPEVVDARVTTYSYFATLGVGLSRGRTYSADEDKPEAARVAVVSHRLWTRRYGGDAALVGRTVRIDGEPAQVIGIGQRGSTKPGRRTCGSRPGSTPRILRPGTSAGTRSPASSPASRPTKRPRIWRRWCSGRWANTSRAPTIARS